MGLLYALFEDFISGIVFNLANRTLQHLTLFCFPSVTTGFQNWEFSERGGQWKAGNSVYKSQATWSLVLWSFLVLVVVGFWGCYFGRDFLSWNCGRWDFVKGAERGSLHSLGGGSRRFCRALEIFLEAGLSKHVHFQKHGLSSCTIVIVF